jgi:putative phosphoesterase
MKIGVLADTHITQNTIDRLKGLVDFFQDVDLIIHAGDFSDFEVYQSIKNYKEVLGVWGNTDDFRLKNTLKEKELLYAAGYTIGVYHGHGNEGTTADRAYQKFDHDNVDIIIFGHSHQPLVQTRNGILMINPGSATNKRKEKYFSCLVLDLLPDRIEVGFSFFKWKL